MVDRDGLIGRQLANFRVDRVLGRGGMATVYYGWDVRLERPVAIKVIDRRLQQDAAFAERFVNEARSVAGLRHPNILQAYYAGDEHGFLYYVMEYIAGQDLGARLDEVRSHGGRLPYPEVTRIGRAVAQALDYAHERGVVHRDVKPSNVLVADDGRVVLADFGLALDVARGTLGAVFGSPHYMAPEQARNSAQAVPQSDLYSLGVVLYEMLTGQVPFDDPSPATLALLHLTETPPPPRELNPALSAAVEAVLLKALRKRPRDRFQTGRALMRALEAALHVPEPTLEFLDDGLRRQGPDTHALRQMLVRLRALGQTAGRWTVRGLASGLEAARWAGRKLGAGWAAAWAAIQPSYPASAAPPTATRPAAPGRDGTRPALGQLVRRPTTWWLAACIGAVVLAPVLWVTGFTVLLSREFRDRASSAMSRAEPAPTATTEPGATTSAEEQSPTEEQPPQSPGAGDHFVMYYDDTAFYMKNLSGQERSVFPLAFERLDASGNPTNRWEGWRWGEIYPRYRAGYCVVVELIDYRKHLDPKECKNRYLITRTPFANDPGIFWTTQPESHHFRVLWAEAEVGRCEIAAKTCEVYLP